MIVVFDTNVVVEAIFWPRSNARRALSGLAKRRYVSAINSAILDEYAVIAARIRERLFPLSQPSGALAWIAAKSLHAEPTPLGGKLSRDPDDNLFIATALAVRAEFIVTQDRDLLVLEKPFGIQIVTPVQIVRHFSL
jgi:putative PIN family toxin of toxin-antitoxin system